MFGAYVFNCSLLTVQLLVMDSMARGNLIYTHWQVRIEERKGRGRGGEHF